jgi:hypothetical protein
LYPIFTGAAPCTWHDLLGVIADRPCACVPGVLLRAADLRLRVGVDLLVRISRAASADDLLTMITCELLVILCPMRGIVRTADEAGNDIPQVTRGQLLPFGCQLGQVFWYGNSGM